MWQRGQLLLLLLVAFFFFAGDVWATSPAVDHRDVVESEDEDEGEIKTVVQQPVQSSSRRPSASSFSGLTNNIRKKSWSHESEGSQEHGFKGRFVSHNVRKFAKSNKRVRQGADLKVTTTTHIEGLPDAAESTSSSHTGKTTRRVVSKPLWTVPADTSDAQAKLIKARKAFQILEQKKADVLQHKDGLEQTIYELENESNEAEDSIRELDNEIFELENRASSMSCPFPNTKVVETKLKRAQEAKRTIKAEDANNAVVDSVQADVGSFHSRLVEASSGGAGNRKLFEATVPHEVIDMLEKGPCSQIIQDIQKHKAELNIQGRKRTTLEKELFQQKAEREQLAKEEQDLEAQTRKLESKMRKLEEEQLKLRDQRSFLSRERTSVDHGITVQEAELVKLNEGTEKIKGDLKNLQELKEDFLSKAKDMTLTQFLEYLPAGLTDSERTKVFSAIAVQAFNVVDGETPYDRMMRESEEQIKELRAQLTSQHNNEKQRARLAEEIKANTEAREVAAESLGSYLEEIEQCKATLVECDQELATLKPHVTQQQLELLFDKLQSYAQTVQGVTYTTAEELADVTKKLASFRSAFDAALYQIPTTDEPVAHFRGELFTNSRKLKRNAGKRKQKRRSAGRQQRKRNVRGKKMMKGKKNNKK